MKKHIKEEIRNDISNEALGAPKEAKASREYAKVIGLSSNVIRKVTVHANLDTIANVYMDLSKDRRASHE